MSGRPSARALVVFLPLLPVVVVFVFSYLHRLLSLLRRCRPSLLCSVPLVALALLFFLGAAFGGRRPLLAFVVLLVFSLVVLVFLLFFFRLASMSSPSFSSSSPFLFLLLPSASASSFCCRSLSLRSRPAPPSRRV